MGDRVTRQFIDETTGDPITGGQFRLVSKTDTAYQNVNLVEIPDQTPGVPDGRYASPTTVQTGVYGIERYINGAWEPTSDELTVEPGRWRNSGGGEMIVGDYLEAVIRAGGHFDPGSNPDLVTLGTVLGYAHDEGYNTVVVGSFRGTKVWAGPSALVVPDGMFLDLAGATIQCSTPDVAAVLCDGTACIVNGTIACSGTGAAQHITAGDAAKEIVCIDVAFTGLASTHATVTTASNGNARATFIGCSNVVVPNIDATLSVAPQTVIGGRQNAAQVNGQPFIPPAQANATATEIGDLVRFVQSAVAPAGSEVPPSSEPFTNMRQVAAAIRDLWFTGKPLIANAANAVNLSYWKKDGDTGIVASSPSLVTAIGVGENGGNIASVTVSTVQRKISVIERGGFRKAELNIAIYALCSFNFALGSNEFREIRGIVTVNIADIKNDLISSFPSNAIKQIKSIITSNAASVSNVSMTDLDGSSIAAYVEPVDNPSAFTVPIPRRTVYFYTPNTKTFILKMEITSELTLVDSSADGLKRKYATISNL